MYRLLTCTFLCLYLGLAGHAQRGLECNGSIYRVIEKSYEVTTLQEVHLDDDRMIIEDLKEYSGHQLNAICFKPDTKRIYGIKFGDPYQLFQIDNDLNLEILSTLPLPQNLFFVAGDIMPDGRHMVVLGYGSAEESNILAIIDLEDENYATELIPLKSNDDNNGVICADIAFHPTTGLLYGFDQTSNSMIQIDIENRTTEIFEDQSYDYEIGVAPAMFFDFNSNLFGFTISNDRNGDNLVYQFDKESGQATAKYRVEDTGSQDACSCPFQVEMYQTINNINQYTCTEAQFTVHFVNRTSIHQTGLSFVDTLPNGMEFKSMDYNPFNALSSLSDNASVVSLTDFDLPIGEDSIVFTVSINQDAQLGYHDIQAWLTQSNPDIRSNLTRPLPSDDPQTLTDSDATGFLIEGANEGNRFEEDVLCAGSSIVLDANVLGVDDFEWSTGETSATIEIDNPGMYEVKLNTPCGEATVAFDITGAFLEIGLGEDLLIDPNESVNLTPEITSSDEISTVIWTEISNIKTLDCYTCIETSATVPFDMGFRVTIENEIGCRASDELFVAVEAVRHYFPNGFSPNSDGVNDVFYLQSKKDYRFKDFLVFDRWGNRIYNVDEGVMNDAAFGWDGKANGQALPPGVFVWSAKVLGFDNQYTEVHGDITLVR